MAATLLAVVVALALGHLAPPLASALRRFGWYRGWLQWLNAQFPEGSVWRGTYGIASPAPICTDPGDPRGEGDQVACQVVRAPDVVGARLVRDRLGAAPDGDAEIRLTYRELTALIAEAVRELA